MTLHRKDCKDPWGHAVGDCSCNYFSDGTPVEIYENPEGTYVDEEYNI